MAVRDVVSACEVGADDVMGTDNCQGDLVQACLSCGPQRDTDSKGLRRKLTGKGFQGECPLSKYWRMHHFKMM